MSLERFLDVNLKKMKENNEKRELEELEMTSNATKEEIKLKKAIKKRKEEYKLKKERKNRG